MKIAVIGTGVMGRGWITQFAMTGHTVHCFDENAKSLDGVADFCKTLAQNAAKRAKVDDPEIGNKTVANIQRHATKAEFVAAAKGCEVLLEVIFEDMALKCRVVGELVPQLPPSVYFWSNTSSLDIDVLAAAGGRPERSLVVHGMNPVPMMPGVEVVPGKKTTPETVEVARKVLLEMKKAPFLAPNVPGFWVNRLLIPQLLDAMRFLERGLVKVEDGDVGMNTSLGHPQGTFKLADFITLPTTLRVAWEMFEATGDPRLYPPQILVRMVKAGEGGANMGKGFYDWTDKKNPKARDLSQYVIKDTNGLLGSVK
jgi:3-hydroxybutyryl-CoA dehydrogenase